MLPINGTLPLEHRQMHIDSGTLVGAYNVEGPSSPVRFDYWPAARGLDWMDPLVVVVIGGPTAKTRLSASTTV